MDKILRNKKAIFIFIAPALIMFPGTGYPYGADGLLFFM